MLTIVLVVIAALALPAAMAGATLYASNAAIVNSAGELRPYFGTAPPPTHPARPATHHRRHTARHTTTHHTTGHRTTGTSHRSGTRTWQQGSSTQGSHTGSRDWSGSSSRWNGGSGWGSGQHSGGGWDN